VARKSLIKVAPVQTRVTSPAKATTNKKLHATKHIAGNEHSSTNGMSKSGYNNISKKVDAFPHTIVTTKTQPAQACNWSVKHHNEQNSTATGIVSVATSTSPVTLQQGRQNLIPKSLADFGITAGLGSPYSPNRQNSPKQCKLRAVIINGTDNDATVVLRCELSPPSFSTNWTEKLFYDAIRRNETWTTMLNISPNTMHWFDGEILQVNNKGFAICLFTIYMSTFPPARLILDVAQHICEQLNNIEGNNMMITVDPSTFFWKRGEVVWADVIGSQKAYDTIILMKGQPYPGFFQQNESFIYTYFHRGSIPDTVLEALCTHPPTLEDLPDIVDSDNDEQSSNDSLRE
jgi:hypothetical protein